MEKQNKTQIEVELFLEYCLKQKKLQELTTIAQYKDDLYKFLNIIDFDYSKSINTIKIEDIDNYINIIYAKNYKKASYNKKIVTLKSLYNFLENKEFITKNIMRTYSTQSAKPSIKSRRCLTKEEIKDVLDNCNKKRNKMIIQLLLYTGFRVGELINLKVNDIMLKSNVLRVISGKGDKDRVVPINENVDLLQLLNDYIEIERKQSLVKFKLNNKTFPYVFISNNGTQLTEKNINNMIKVQCSQAKVENYYEITPHNLRHTFATDLYNNGVDLLTISRILGHESVATTQLYIGASEEDMKKAVNKCWIKESK
ncbi:MAG: tyrosine-type recombinase/integrase [Clostridia bacterium]